MRDHGKLRFFCFSHPLQKRVEGEMDIALIGSHWLYGFFE
jgi:hypothetical protein